jgi:spermidine synthase
VVLGDARLRMAQELREHGPGRYDVLAIDAFSSDAISIHLLTAETADLYWELLDRDGLLVFHISNRFLELEPVVLALALHTGAQVMRFRTEKSRSRGFDRSTWLVLARRDSEFLRHPEVESVGSLLEMSGRVVPWTDDFASL